MKSGKKTALVIGSVIILLLILAVAAVFVYKNQAKKAEAKTAELQKNVIEGDCESESLVELETMYDEIKDLGQKADVSATIAQCASVEFKEMEKSVEWSKKARDNYSAVGNQEKADQFDMFVNRYEPYLADPSQQLEEVEDVDREGSDYGL
jgi:hypothetical protein